jgi:hypothetical protein
MDEARKIVAGHIGPGGLKCPCCNNGWFGKDRNKVNRLARRDLKQKDRMENPCEDVLKLRDLEEGDIFRVGPKHHKLTKKGDVCEAIELGAKKAAPWSPHTFVIREEQ